MSIASAHYSLPPWQAFRPSGAAWRRCLLPASATDLQYEHPQIVRFPGAWLTPSRPPVALTHVQSDSAASDPLAENQPQVDSHLTARFQLQANRAQPCPEEESSTAPGDAALQRRFQPPARLFSLPSEHLLSHPAGFGDRNLRGIESHSIRPFVNKNEFPGPRCLPSTSAPEGTRHRARGLAAGEPASSALSLRECLRTARLDVRRVHRFFTRGFESHTLLVNFCNRNDPRPQPLERQNPAHCASGVTHWHCAA